MFHDQQTRQLPRVSTSKHAEMIDLLRTDGLDGRPLLDDEVCRLLEHPNDFVSTDTALHWPIESIFRTRLFRALLVCGSGNPPLLASHCTRSLLTSYLLLRTRNYATRRKIIQDEW